MLQIGITGGIGSGKSTICKIFSTLGTPVYDADSRAKQLMIDDMEVISQIISEFGEESYQSEGQLNRDYLAKTVFSDSSRLKKLNSIVHPAVGRDFSSWVQNQSTKYVLKEAALLIESGSYKKLDKLIVVTAPVDLRVERIKKRDPHRSEEEIRGIIANQLSDEQRLEHADIIIANDDSQLIIPQIVDLHREFNQ